VDLDHESDIPLYRQIADALRERIESGRYRPRRQMPSEAVLQRETEVARDTIRRAIAHLAELGLVYTVRGKGTFVRGGQTVITAEPGMRIFARTATPSERTTLEVGEGAPVLVIERAGGEVEVVPGGAGKVRVPE
jgi:DNA-binding GntR family transcriptional regulator